MNKPFALRRVSDVLDRICGALIVVLLGAMVLVTAAQILARFLCSYFTWIRPLSWSEELTRYMLIWSTFLGATCVYYHGGNIAITAVQGLLPEKSRNILKTLVHLVCLVLFVILTIYGIRYTQKLGKNATSLPVKMRWIFICVPVSTCVMAWHALVLMLENLTGPGHEGKEAKN